MSPHRTKNVHVHVFVYRQMFMYMYMYNLLMFMYKQCSYDVSSTHNYTMLYRSPIVTMMV